MRAALKTIAAMAAALILVLPLSACNQTVEGYAGVTKKDYFGDYGITLLGDSISHGANAEDIPNAGYVGLLKKAINDKAGTTAKGTANYGFTTVEGTLWNDSGTHKEIHEFPTPNPSFGRTTWMERRSAELLGTKGLACKHDGYYLDFFPQETFRYFCVYYEQSPTGGTFTVGTGDTVLADEKGQTEVNCQAEETGPARTPFYDFSKLENNSIRITCTGKQQITVTGIGYYNDKNAVVLNSYANTGLLFSGGAAGADEFTGVTGLDESILDIATDSETLIFALGYNDSHSNPSTHKEVFTEKINYLIEKANEKGTKIVVNDLCWAFSVAQERQTAYYKDELKRLADETGGLYVDQQEINGKALLRTIKDGAHPSAEGHQMIADTLIAAMELGTEATDG